MRKKIARHFLSPTLHYSNAILCLYLPIALKINNPHPKHQPRPWSNRRGIPLPASFCAEFWRWKWRSPPLPWLTESARAECTEACSCTSGIVAARHTRALAEFRRFANGPKMVVLKQFYSGTLKHDRKINSEKKNFINNFFSQNIQKKIEFYLDPERWLLILVALRAESRR